jgi:hypothetical protein
MVDSNYGQASPFDGTHDLNVLQFIIRMALGQVSTLVPVKVTAVTTNGDVARPGTVDVQPLVKLIDGNGLATDPGIVNGLPWFRLGSGRCAVIIDPRVGDIGLVVCSDRDISSLVANNGTMSTPGSRRRFSLSDGVYIGGFLMDTPDCYVLFNEDGTIKVSDAKGNVLETSNTGFGLTGNVAVTGNISATGTIIAGRGGADQVNVQTHVHPTAALGAPSPPTPGT